MSKKKKELTFAEAVEAASNGQVIESCLKWHYCIREGQWNMKNNDAKDTEWTTKFALITENEINSSWHIVKPLKKSKYKIYEKYYACYSNGNCVQYDTHEEAMKIIGQHKGTFIRRNTWPEKLEE